MASDRTRRLTTAGLQTDSKRGTHEEEGKAKDDPGQGQTIKGKPGVAIKNQHRMKETRPGWAEEDTTGFSSG